MTLRTSDSAHWLESFLCTNPSNSLLETSMPKVVRFHQTGGPEVLKFEDVPPQQPGAGEVRLKVQAIGLNRAESMFYHGQYL
jgi:hypothetical protein